MGLSLSFASLVVQASRHPIRRDAVITLGRQSLDFGKAAAFGLLQGMAPQDIQETPLSPEQFFQILGFATVHSLDVSAFEGATHVHDLNEPPHCLPKHLVSSYDLVVDGGTLEHCFHFPNALGNALSMVLEGGIFLHIGPMHNYVDHGFYQFSPTLFRDFASANNWDILTHKEIRFHPPKLATSSATNLEFLSYGQVGSLDPDPRMQFVVMRRNKNSIITERPLQNYYKKFHNPKPAF